MDIEHQMPLPGFTARASSADRVGRHSSHLKTTAISADIRAQLR
jgi:hypothetical protein